MGTEFDFVEVSTAEPVGKKRGGDESPIARVFEKGGISHCDKHSFDIFVDPLSVSDAALRHAAAELFFLSRM